MFRCAPGNECANPAVATPSCHWCASQVDPSNLHKRWRSFIDLRIDVLTHLNTVHSCSFLAFPFQSGFVAFLAAILRCIKAEEQVCTVHQPLPWCNEMPYGSTFVTPFLGIRGNPVMSRNPAPDIRVETNLWNFQLTSNDVEHGCVYFSASPTAHAAAPLHWTIRSQALDQAALAARWAQQRPWWNMAKQENVNMVTVARWYGTWMKMVRSDLSIMTCRSPCKSSPRWSCGFICSTFVKKSWPFHGTSMRLPSAKIYLFAAALCTWRHGCLFTCKGDLLTCQTSWRRVELAFWTCLSLKSREVWKLL